MVVEGWLHRAARTRPGEVAVESLDGSCTYAELYAAARAGAGLLMSRGVLAGDRVAIALPPGLAFAEAFHACLLLGAVAVPVDLRLSAAERTLVCADAPVVEERLLERSVGGGAPGGRGASGLRGLAGEQAGSAAGRSGHDLDAVAAVIHTSGTTSAPRAIELTYGNFLWSALGSAVALDLDPCERWLCALPVSHVGGLSILVRSAIYGTTAVIHPRWDTELALEALREREITLVSLVATTLARLLDAMPAHLERPLALRYALTGGGPVPEALVRRAREAGVPVSTTYGLTEACSQVTTGGPPLFCTRVRIAVAENAAVHAGRSGEKAAENTRAIAGMGKQVGESSEGEILVRGPTVARGALQPDGWLHTGDLGSLDERGFLRVTGRVADTIVSGGENVAPAEVEAVLEAHPDVREAAVLGRADPKWGEAVAAIVVLRDGAKPDTAAESLRAHCAGRLARYKVPKQIDFTGTPLPRTWSGKLLRRELA